MSKRRGSRGSSAPNPAVFYAILETLMEALGSFQGKMAAVKAVPLVGTDKAAVGKAVDVQGTLHELITGVLNSVFSLIRNK